MVVVNVRCPDCGNVLCQANTLVIDEEAGEYRFTCPACRKGISRPLSDAVLEVLRVAGVPTLEQSVAAFADRLQEDDIHASFGLA